MISDPNALSMTSLLSHGKIWLTNWVIWGETWSVSNMQLICDNIPFSLETSVPFLNIQFRYDVWLYHYLSCTAFNIKCKFCFPFRERAINPKEKIIHTINDLAIDVCVRIDKFLAIKSLSTISCCWGIDNGKSYQTWVCKYAIRVTIWVSVYKPLRFIFSCTELVITP